MRQPISANTPAQKVLRLQRTIGNRGVQRLILARQPDSPAPGSKPTATAETPGVVSASSVSGTSAALETIPTEWFIDFEGLGGGLQGQKGRPNRKPSDVLLLEHLSIGPKERHKTFAKAGNALASGYAALGPFDHPKGIGNVRGEGTYATSKEVQVKFIPNVPPQPAPANKAEKTARDAEKSAAEKAATEAVTNLIHDYDGNAADWDQVEKDAAHVAAANLPEGSAPVVSIFIKGNHEKYSLETTQYRVDKPASCTVKIIVPTTTTTFQVHGGGESTETESAAAEGSVRTTEKIDVGWEFKTFVETVKSSLVRVTNSLHQRIISQDREGDVTSDPGSDLSLGDRLKNWLKDKASDLWDKAKGKFMDLGTKFLKKKLVGWITKLIEKDNWVWIKLTEWGVDWLGDKVKSWLSVKTHRGPDDKKNCGPTSVQQKPPQPGPSSGQCPTGSCHYHPGGPGNPLPGPQSPTPTVEPCPPEIKPPFITDSDQTLTSIVAETTKEMTAFAAHVNLEQTKEETQSAAAGKTVTRHTEHYYSGPVTKQNVGHPAIQVIVEDHG